MSNIKEKIRQMKYSRLTIIEKICHAALTNTIRYKENDLTFFVDSKHDIKAILTESVNVSLEIQSELIMSFKGPNQLIKSIDEVKSFLDAATNILGIKVDFLQLSNQHNIRTKYFRL